MKRSRLLIVLLLIAAGAAFMFSKEGNTPEKGDGKDTVEQSITFALHSIPDSVDPGVTSETYAGPILNNAFEGLVT